MGTESLKKAEYRIKNWREYNEALVNRGSLTFWFDEEAIAAWGESERTGRRGAPRRYSDLAVQCALTLRAVFRLPLRATEGLVCSVLELMGLPLPTPDQGRWEGGTGSRPKPEDLPQSPGVALANRA